MNLIDIAVAPYFENRLKDASPMKLFEYMAMAKPVIIPGVGQVTEIILNMESGVLVEAENILSLYGDKSLASRLGENARKTALMFDRAKQVKAYHALFRSLTSTGIVSA